MGASDDQFIDIEVGGLIRMKMYRGLDLTDQPPLVTRDNKHRAGRRKISRQQSLIDGIMEHPIHDILKQICLVGSDPID